MMNVEGICNYIAITEKTFGREISKERMHSLVLIFQIARIERSDYKLFIGDAFFIAGRPHIRAVSQARIKQENCEKTFKNCSEVEIVLLQRILHRTRGISDKELCRALYRWFGVNSKKFKVDKSVIKAAMSQEPKSIEELCGPVISDEVVRYCLPYYVFSEKWEFPQLFYQTHISQITLKSRIIG